MSNGGSEYQNKKVQDLITSTGAEFSYSPPYVPQINGAAERLNRTLLNYARSLIIDSKFVEYSLLCFNWFVAKASLNRP